MPSDATVAFADTTADLLRGAASWLSLGTGTVALVAAGGAFAVGADWPVPVVMLTVAALLLALGLAVNARFRRRLARRRSVTTFGTVRSVDQRTVPPGADLDARCVACDAPVDEGLQRRFREEYAVAGVPLSTRSERFNHYCLDCALAELDLDVGPDEGLDGATVDGGPAGGTRPDESLPDESRETVGEPER